MNNYINPFTLIKENYLEATTISEKIISLIVGLWVTFLLTLVIIGVTFMFYQIITDPSQFDNVTWGIFDTLG